MFSKRLNALTVFFLFPWNEKLTTKITTIFTKLTTNFSGKPVNTSNIQKTLTRQANRRKMHAGIRQTREPSAKLCE